MQLFVCTWTPFIATTNNSSLKTVKSSINYLTPPLIIHVCLFSDLISNYETLFIIENIKRNFKMVELTHKVFSFKLNRLTAVVLLSTIALCVCHTADAQSSDFPEHRKTARRLFDFPEPNPATFPETILRNSLRQQLKQRVEESHFTPFGRESKSVWADDRKGRTLGNSLPAPLHGPIRPPVPAYSLEWVREGRMKAREISQRIRRQYESGNELLNSVTEYGINETNYLIRVHEPTLFTEGNKT